MNAVIAIAFGIIAGILVAYIRPIRKTIDRVERFITRKIVSTVGYVYPKKR